MLRAHAKALAKERPTNKEPKSPGRLVTATASTSSTFNPALSSASFVTA
jgi:hypothetical protein